MAMAAVIFLAGDETQAASVTGHASVTVLRALSASESAPLSFGTITPAATTGSISVSPAGAVSGSPGLTLVGGGAPGSFVVTGTPSSAITISFSSADTLTGPGPALALGDYSDDAGPAPVLDRSGTLRFSVGATLAVNAAQPPGIYSGTYSVTVNY